MKLDGQIVAGVTRVAWQTDDDETQLAIGVIVGRATVDTQGGGQYHGLLFLTDNEDESRYAVVVWERSTKRFAVLQLDARSPECALSPNDIACGVKRSRDMNGIAIGETVKVLT